MKDIDWRPIDRHALAVLLSEAKRLTSRAIGGTTIYRLEHNNREVIAMALSDGHALVVEQKPQAKWRRRIDANLTTNPASR